LIRDGSEERCRSSFFAVNGQDAWVSDLRPVLACPQSRELAADRQSIPTLCISGASMPPKQGAGSRQAKCPLVLHQRCQHAPKAGSRQQTGKVSPRFESAVPACPKSRELTADRQNIPSLCISGASMPPKQGAGSRQAKYPLALHQGVWGRRQLAPRGAEGRSPSQKSSPSPPIGGRGGRGVRGDTPPLLKNCVVN